MDVSIVPHYVDPELLGGIGRKLPRGDESMRGRGAAAASNRNHSLYTTQCITQCLSVSVRSTRKPALRIRLEGSNVHSHLHGHVSKPRRTLLLA